jgi:fumarate reductase subunit C
MKKFFRHVFWREAMLATLFCLILIAVLIATSSDSQTWIYQGF